MVHTFFNTSTIDLSSPSHSTWTRFKSGDCPICQGERKDCRQSPTTGLVFCLYSGPPKDPEWVHRTNDINGFGVYGKKRTEEEIAIDKATWLAEKKQREAAEKKRQAQFAKQVMAVEKRDRHYHQLLAGLSRQLHPDDWADLSRRGISDEQTKKWLITSVDEWQELGKKFPKNLPGIGRDRNGVSQLWNGYPGYIVPTQSPDGKITSLGQVRNRNFVPGEYQPKYPWISGSSDKNPGGMPVDLPNGDWPLQVALPTEWDMSRVGQVGFCEGVGIKPLLAADRIGIPVIGASSANFLRSKETTKQYFREILELWDQQLNQHQPIPSSSTSPKLDSDSSQRSPISNPTQEKTGSSQLLESALKPLSLLGNKLQDILSQSSGSSRQKPASTQQNTPSSIVQPIVQPIAIILPDAGMLDLNHKSVIAKYHKTHKILDELGVRVKIAWWGQTTKDAGDIDEISPEMWAIAQFITWATFIEKLQYKIPKEFLLNEIERLDKLNTPIEEVEENYRLGQKLSQKAIALISKIFHPLPPKDKKVSLNFAPVVDSVQNREGKPPVTVETTAIALYDPTYAKRRWWLDVTPDTVPSYDDWLEMGSPKLYYQRDQAQEIWTALVEAQYPVVSVEDITGQGKSHQTGEFLERWPEAREHIEGSKKGRGFFMASDYRNPTTHSLEGMEEKVSGGAIAIDKTKTTPLGHPHRKRHTRVDIPPNHAALCREDHNIQTLREMGEDIYRGEKTTYCRDICGMADHCPFLQAKKLQMGAPTLRLHPLSLRVGENEGAVGFIDEASRGIPFIKMAESTSQQVELEVGKIARFEPAVYQRYRPIIDEIAQGLYRATAETGEYGFTHAEMMKFLPSKERLEQLLFECQWGTMFEKDDWCHRETDVWTSGKLFSLGEFLKECVKPDFVEALVGVSDQNRSKRIRDWFSAGAIGRTLRIIATGKGTISVDRAGFIKFQHRDSRAIGELRKLRTLFLLDATPDKWEFSRKLGYRIRDVVSVASYSPTFKNLTIKVVQGIGNPTTRRESRDKNGNVYESDYCIQNRVTTAIAHIASLAEGTTGVIDYRSMLSHYDGIDGLITGYCFYDNRGSNAFEQCSQMISVPRPTPNLGAKLSEYQLLTGRSHSIDDAPGGFWSWVKRSQTNELIQDVGRLRAQWRQGEELTHWFLSPLDEGQLDAIRRYFPGCRVEMVPVLELCPEAAPKGDQVAHHLINSLWDQIQQGNEPTIGEIAQEIGRSKGRVSQISKSLPTHDFRGLRKSLVFLFKAINSETKLSELPEDVQWIVSSYLPTLANELRAHELSSEEVVEEMRSLYDAFGPERFEQIMSGVSPSTLSTFISALLDSGGGFSDPFNDLLSRSGIEDFVDSASIQSSYAESIGSDPFICFFYS